MAVRGERRMPAGLSALLRSEPIGLRLTADYLPPEAAHDVPVPKVPIVGDEAGRGHWRLGDEPAPPTEAEPDG